MAGLPLTTLTPLALVIVCLAGLVPEVGADCRMSGEELVIAVGYGLSRAAELLSSEALP